MRTRCRGFSSSRASLSESGEPIQNSPAGMRASFMPMAFVSGGTVPGILLLAPDAWSACSAPRAGAVRRHQGATVIAAGCSVVTNPKHAMTSRPAKPQAAKSSIVSYSVQEAHRYVGPLDVVQEVPRQVTLH